MNAGHLTLVPTPIDEDSILEPMALAVLAEAVQQRNTLIVVEEEKEARRRWIRWGLPRETIGEFVLLNEHTSDDETPRLIELLKEGNNLFLMSDGGLPAFCDPGRELVDRCHRQHIRVTSTPFPNSVMLGLVLSGFPSNAFVFHGFPPAKSEERAAAFQQYARETRTMILMDAPYRLKRVMEELALHMGKREVFIGIDLNMPTETLLRGAASWLLSRIPDGKHEFIIVVSAL